MAVAVRTLGRGDEHILADFLESRADSSMFLRANLQASGIVDTGKPYTGTFVAALEGTRIEAVVSLFWNGFLSVQAPYHLGPILTHLNALQVRPIKGLLGPLAQTDEARLLLGMRNAATRKNSREDLFALGLNQLVVPGHLAAGRWTSRQPRPAEIGMLIEWRVASGMETLGGADDEEARRDAAETIRRQDGEGSLWVLEVDGRVVSMNSYNARIPDMVQIGGVFTPQDLRGLGFARACVAGSLLAARRAGVVRSVLFTPKENASAQAAYRAIGFRVVGEYGLVVFQ